VLDPKHVRALRLFNQLGSRFIDQYHLHPCLCPTSRGGASFAMSNILCTNLCSPHAKQYAFNGLRALVASRNRMRCELCNCGVNDMDTALSSDRSFLPGRHELLVFNDSWRNLLTSPNP
jgi:hypothetical protein